MPPNASDVFESVCEHLSFSIYLLRSSKNAEFSKFVNDRYLIVMISLFEVCLLKI